MKPSPFIHYRRCHVCGGVTERDEKPVGRCDHCGKNLAPYYFFDETDVSVYSVDEELPDDEKRLLRPPHESGPRRPIRGVSVVW